MYPMSCLWKLNQLRFRHGSLEPERIADAHQVVLVASHDSHLGYLRRDAGQSFWLDVMRQTCSHLRKVAHELLFAGDSRAADKFLC